MKKRYVGYGEYGDLVGVLIPKVKNQYEGLQFVYAPPRGGLPIAVHMSHHLGLKFEWCFFNNDNMLVVDDICDTGSTFISLVNNLVPRVKAATLFAKESHKYRGDLVCVETIPEDVWVVFPWERG